jgi:hypothetical protein
VGEDLPRTCASSRGANSVASTTIANSESSTTISRGSGEALSSAPEQSTLSRWSMKTAMVFEATSGKNFYSQDEQQELRTSGVLPAETSVWFGRYGQSNILCGEGRHLHENTSSTANPYRDGYTTTLLMRRLVIQVLILRRKPEFQEIPAKLHIKEGPWDKNLIQIWPIGNRSLQWPPPLSFSNDTIDFPTLSGRFVSNR